MNPDQKLALVTQVIKDAGTSSPTELREKLAEIPMLASAKEIPAWRTNDFDLCDWNQAASYEL